MTKKRSKKQKRRDRQAREARQWNYGPGPIPLNRWIIVETWCEIGIGMTMKKSRTLSLDRKGYMRWRFDER